VSYVVIPVVGIGISFDMDYFVTRIQNTLLVLALDLVVYTLILSYFGRISLVGSLHLPDVFLMLKYKMLRSWIYSNTYSSTHLLRCTSRLLGGLSP
jgi:hypothetical protein